MPWRIGIDEAGYGPNLGPFVMTATACRVPKALAQACLWETLRPLVRQARHGADQRLLIDDSKKVYAGGKGLADLEIAALLALDGQIGGLGEVVPQFAADSRADLGQECWFTGRTPLPLASNAAAVPLFAARWKELCARLEITWLRPISDIVCTPRFNALIDRYGTKGAVLGMTFVRLVQALLPQAPEEEVDIVVDKHGGRNQYQSLLTHAFPEGWVLPREEGGRQSVYEVQGLNRPVRVTFRVQADGGEMTVALASMISKYLREALMGEWNAYWQTQVPGIKATAGYPQDARRFFEEIQPAAAALKLEREQLWRKR